MAGPMSGDYVIGSSTYPTFNAAIDSLVKHGIDGPVVFEVVSGTYDEQVLIPHISGTSEFNTITFEAQTPGEDNAILQFASSDPLKDYIMLIDSSRFINLKGLTFIPTGTGLLLSSLGITNEANNISIENNFFKSPIDPNGYQIYLEPAFLDDEKIKHINLINNKFTGGSYGFSIISGTHHADSISIIENEFKDQTTSSIFVWGGNNLTISKNKFLGDSQRAIWLVENNEEVTIKDNLVSFDNYSALQTGIIVQEQFLGLVSGKTIKVFNNIIDMGWGNAIQLASANGVEFKHNTVNTRNPFPLAMSSLYAVDSDTLTFHDNVIQNFGLGPILNINNTAVESDWKNNVYFTEGDTIVYQGSARYRTLDEWKLSDAPGLRDEGSAFSKIEFLDTVNYDLVHCSADPSLQFSSAGSFDPAELANDYNGVARNPANFWPGATELTIDEGKIVKVSGFVAQGTDTLKAGTLVAYIDSSDRQLLDQVGETTINADGSFSFDSVPALPLWIRIYPEDTNFLTSYHDSVIRKSQSTPLNPLDCNGLQTDIFPRRIYDFEFDGLGTIEGYVTYADLSSSKVTAKDPIPGLDVVLDRIPPSKSIKATVTNGDNFYSFGGLPDGTYSVTIEYEGLPADTIYVIDVISSDPRNTDKNYCIDTTRAITDCTPPESVNNINNNYKVYPNPFSDNILINATQELDRVRVYDIKGVLIFDQIVKTNNFTLNTEDLLPAVYFIELLSEEKRVVKKVIKH